MIQFFLIKSLGGNDLINCYNSFQKTSCVDDNIDIIIVNELSSREATLNFILSIREEDCDIFIFVDDIIFLAGWYENLLEKSKLHTGIIGYSMLNIDGSLQDYGYDFILIDDKISYKPNKEHLTLPNIQNDCRVCDTVCGCAMYISKEVFKHVPQFSKEGYNRWSEIFFSIEALQFGFETIVLSNNLVHKGTSTKNNSNVKLSSLSWIYERDLWDSSINKYLPLIKPKKNLTRFVTDQLLNDISKIDNLLIFGTGTVADYILSKITNKKITFSTGLSEEAGLKFNGFIVEKIHELKLSEYDGILFTTIGYEFLINEYFKKYYDKLIIVNQTSNNSYIKYYNERF